MNETTKKSKTRPITWREAHSPLAEISANCRDASMDLACPELALAHLVFEECASHDADPGEAGEGDTMALHALHAMQGLGALIVSSAAVVRRSFRTDIADSNDRREVDRSEHLRRVRTAAAQLVDLIDLHDVTMGLAPMRGAK